MNHLTYIDSGTSVHQINTHEKWVALMKEAEEKHGKIETIGLHGWSGKIYFIK